MKELLRRAALGTFTLAIAGGLAFGAQEALATSSAAPTEQWCYRCKDVSQCDFLQCAGGVVVCTAPAGETQKCCRCQGMDV